MGDEVMTSDYGVSGDGHRVSEWEMGLPSEEDLASLSHSLIPANLAVAFSITPERSRTIQDVNQASEITLSSLRIGYSVAVEEEDRVGSSSPGSDSKKQKISEEDGDGDGMDLSTAVAEEEESGTDDLTGKSTKRPRLVWTPQLHKRFVDVVGHLGIKSAVPKTIMQLMNVEGLTRENVASHLQKYRLYLKRMQGSPTGRGGGGGASSSSDKLFSSTPVPPHSFHDIGGGGSNGHVARPVPMMPMPVYAHHMGMQGYHYQKYGHEPRYHNHGNGGPGAFDTNVYTMQQNKFGSMASYPSSVGGGSANEN